MTQRAPEPPAIDYKFKHCKRNANMLVSALVMLALLLGNGTASGIEPRLTKLGIRWQHYTKDTIRDLNHDSAELIYLLPFKTLKEVDWPQLRVKLAQANRCYIVVSGDLSSAEIMNAARDGAYDVLLSSDADERWLEAMRK